MRQISTYDSKAYIVISNCIITKIKVFEVPFLLFTKTAFEHIIIMAKI